MPSQQEVRWSQLKVGVIVLVAAVVLTTLLFLMTSASGLGVFSRKLTVTTYFENSGRVERRRGREPGWRDHRNGEECDVSLRNRTAS